MACIINIETSSQVGSLSITDGEQILFYRSDTEKLSHSASLGRFASDALKFLKEKNMHPDAVAVSEGPGSYTGLRIGVSLAKGLCYGLQIPLIAVPTLELLTSIAISQITDHLNADDLLIPMLDARRMEVYTAVYQPSMQIVEQNQAAIIDAKSFLHLSGYRKIFIFGSGSEKCREILELSNAVFLPNITTNARFMGSISSEKFCKNVFADVAYFEPFYLKEFQATTPKEKIPGLK
jgi:tRNA threonylcarbamoyladenosine biosynthesis protein TsaB